MTISYGDAVQLMLTNKFTEAEERLKGCETPRHALMYAQVSFARACLSLSKTDAADALERAWAAEKLAAAAIPQQGLISSFTSMLGGASDDQAENIEDKLVQADAFLIGSLMQLLSGSYVKGAWNLSTAWKSYKSTYDLMQEKPDSFNSSLRALVLFGVGFFNLVVSLLPGTYLSVAELAGFSGDRVLALKLLSEAVTLDEYWSPFANLLLLYFFTQLSPLLGLPLKQHFAQADELLKAGLEKYPDASLFLWMKGSLQRCKTLHGDSIVTNTEADELSSELPPMQFMIRYDQAWSCILMGDHGKGQKLFQQLLEHPLGKDSLSFKYKQAMCALAAEDTATARVVLKDVKEQAGKAVKANDHKSIDAFVASQISKLDLEKELSPSHAHLCLLECVALWDATSLLPESFAAQSLENMDKEVVSNSDAAVRARGLLVLGMLLGVTGAVEEARSTLATLIELSSGPEVPNHYLPFAWYHVGLLSMRQGNHKAAAEELAKAEGIQSNPFFLADMFYIKVGCTLKHVQQLIEA